MLVESSVRGRARRPVDADAVTPRQGGLSGVAVLVFREGHRVEGQCASANREHIVRGISFVVREIVTPQRFPIRLAEGATGVVLQLSFLPQHIARRANRTPDGSAGDGRLAQAVAVEADDGSLAVAVGDSIDTTDVEFRRQGDGDGELIACECHLSSPPLGVSSHIKCSSFAFVTSMDRMLRSG